LKQSGLETDIDTILHYRYAHIEEVRSAVRHVAAQFVFDLPENAYKRQKFLDDAYLHVYEGDPKGDWRVTDKVAVDKRYEPLRRAAKALFAIPGIDRHLETIITGKIAEVFIEARKTANPTLLKIYEGLPPKIQDQFRQCAACAGGTAGGAALGHAGCVVAMGSGFLPVAGAAGSVATIGLGAAFTAAVVGTWYYLRGRFADPLQQKIVIGGAIAGTVLAGAWHLTGSQDHGHGPTPHEHHTLTPQRQAQVADWISRQSPENLLRVMEQAKARKMSLEDYAAQICGEEEKTIKNQIFDARP
jgi:hypothetical protein